MTEFHSRWLDWGNSHTPENRTDRTDRTDRRSISDSQAPENRTDRTDRSPPDGLHPPSVSSVSAIPGRSQDESISASLADIHPKSQPEGEIADLWGKLAPVVRLFVDATPPAEPFLLKRGVRISDPAMWWRNSIIDIRQGPEGPRARYGALQDDLWRVYRMFGPGAVRTEVRC